MEEVNHDRIKSKRKKKNEEKSSEEDGADSTQLEEGGGGGGGRDGRNEEKKMRGEKRKKKGKEAKKKEKDSEASVSRLEEGGGGGEEGESREGSRVSGKKDKEGKSCEIEKKKEKEKGKRKCEGDDGKESILDSEETNKKMKKKEKRKKEEQSIDLEEKVSSDNQVEDSNKKKKEKKKDETGLEEIGEENEKDGDFKKKKTIKEKRKRDEEKDRTDGNKRAKKAKKTSKSEDSNGEKKKKNDGKRVRFSGEVEVFPSGRESEEREETGEEKMVQGKRFTKEEDKMILQAIDDYIKKHQLGENGSQMILQCSRHKELRNCWDEIITCMPYRPKYAIYNRAHVLLTRSQIRNWSTEDFEALKKHKEMHGAKWKEFADQRGINRKAVKDAWRRIRLPNAKTGAWSQQEYQTLFDLVNTDLKMKAFEEKKTMHGMLKDNIAWEAISDKLATRLHYYCCIKWYDQLSSPMVKEGLWLDTDDYRLIQALQKTDANCLEEVEWDHILEHREGEICRKRWEQMIRYIGDHKEKSFIEQVELLSKRYCPDMIEVREKYDGNEFADK